MGSDQLLVLIDAIYSAAVYPSQWPSVVRQIQIATGGHSVNLMFEDLLDTRINSVYSNGASEAQIERYQNEILVQDRFTAIYEKMAPGTSFVSQDYFSEKALHSLYCFANFNAGLFYKGAWRRGWLSVVRSESEPPYTPDECLLMQALTPHLCRAFLVNVQLLEAQNTSKIALDSLEYITAATMFLASKGQVVRHNSRAEPYLHHAGLSVNDTTLRLPDSSANRQLHDLIASVIHGNSCDQEAVVPFIEKGVQKTALCFPWRNSQEQLDWLEQSAFCIVFILSPAANAPRAELLQQTFGLSKAEVKVLQRLMGGMQVAEIAGVLFVSVATVRFHVRNLLQKTGSRNQAELISRVFNTLSVRVG